MGIDAYTLRKSQSVTTEIGGERVKILNLGYAFKYMDANPMNWYDKESKRFGALCNARIEKARANIYPETVLFVVDLDNQFQ